MPRAAWAVIIVAGLAVAALIFVYRSYSVPAGSMAPTLLAGDRLIVNSRAYGALGRPPARGDVAVFTRVDTGEDYLKRVVGLPGETVQLRDGVLYINDMAVPRERLKDFVLVDGTGRRATVARFRETLPGGRQMEVLERSGDAGPYDDTDVFTVPEGHYFLLGDNRDNSLDSRAGIGFVPAGNFVGRAELIWLSDDVDRLFTVVR